MLIPYFTISNIPSSLPLIAHIVTLFIYYVDQPSDSSTLQTILKFEEQFVEGSYKIEQVVWNCPILILSSFIEEFGETTFLRRITFLMLLQYSL